MPFVHGQRPGAGADAGRPLRCGALCQLLLFALALFSTGAGLHGCPRVHHSRAPASLAAGGPAPQGAPVVHAREPTSPHGPGGSGSCSCIGACQSGATVALRPVPPGLTADPAAGPAVVPARHARALPSGPPAYFLPYPLGPPTA